MGHSKYSFVKPRKGARVERSNVRGDLVQEIPQDKGTWDSSDAKSMSSTTFEAHLDSQRGHKLTFFPVACQYEEEENLY